MANPLFTRDQLDAAFHALSSRLDARAVEAQVVLFGDAAMMFAYDARESIDHVDAAPRPRGQVLGAARDAAGPLGLPAHWINDQSVGALPKFIDDDLTDLFQLPHLAVRTLVPEVLLTMSALAPTRPEALDDLRSLAAAANIVDLIDVEVLIAEIFPGRSLSAKARTVLESVFA
jgi:hypothetical protein